VHSTQRIIRRFELLVLVAVVGACLVIAVKFRSRAYESPTFLQTTAPGSLIISAQVIGSELAATTSFEMSVTCSNSPTKAVTVSVPRGDKKTVGVTEFPGLTNQDRCSVMATGIEGAQTSYATSQPARSDGSVPDPLPGALEAGSFRSALAPADGRLVAVTYSFVGDLQVSAKVAGAPAGSTSSSTITVRCSNSGFVSSSRISNGQTRLFTNIPAGSICKVATDQTNGVSFQDNSDDPRDGIVLVNATPARCWDLRTSTADCRATVIVNSTYNSAEDISAQTVNTQPTTTEPSTSVPTTAAPATVVNGVVAVAPAPVEEPAILSDLEVAYTG
jgi:hypothetical protein